MLYGTTREFLKVFGLAGIDDLPEVEGLPRESSHRTAAPASRSSSTEDDARDDEQPVAADEADSKPVETDEADITEPA